VEIAMPDLNALADQLNHVLEARPEAVVDNPNWAEDRSYGYIYRRGHLLTRAGDEDRVRSRLDGYLREHAARYPDAARAGAVAPDDAGGADGAGEHRGPRVDLVAALPGARLLSFSSGLDTAQVADPPVPEILDHLDEVLGVGVARPDHILTAASHACPATEPVPVPARSLPALGAGEYEQCACGTCAGDGVVVSIIDTGLVGRAADDSAWLTGVQGDPDPLGVSGEVLEYTGHGTFSAGVVRTIVPEASIYVERGVQYGGAAFESELAAQFAEGLRKNPDLVVFCFAADTRKELSLLGFDAVYDQYVREAKGIVVLAPAGNEGTRNRKFPAASAGIIGVGALCADWSERASFSSFGGWVDVFAPGEDIVNAFANGTYTCHWQPDKGTDRQFTGQARWSGTSFSTPMVAGLIAARMSATGENSVEAAAVLMEQARQQVRRGVGPVLLPAQGCPCAKQGQAVSA
jgi:Subtilase family